MYTHVLTHLCVQYNTKNITYMYGLDCGFGSMSSCLHTCWFILDNRDDRDDRDGVKSPVHTCNMYLETIA